VQKLRGAGRKKISPKLGLVCALHSIKINDMILLFKALLAISAGFVLLAL
jgi:hypothetical protein